MYYPSFTQFKKRAKKENLIPVYREILADMETPVSIFLKINNNKENAFILENAEGCKKWQGRYSFIGVTPKTVVGRIGLNTEITKNCNLRIVQNNIIANLIERLLSTYATAITKDISKLCGTVGCYMYDLAENINLWTILFILTDTIVVFDNFNNKIKVIANAHIRDGDDPKTTYNCCLHKINKLIKRLKKEVIPIAYYQLSPNDVITNFPVEKLIQSFPNNKERIGAVDDYQMVLFQRAALPVDIAHFNIYRILRTQIYDRYILHMRIDGSYFILIGSSVKAPINIEDHLTY